MARRRSSRYKEFKARVRLNRKRDLLRSFGTYNSGRGVLVAYG